jgi:hypothetical protein
LSVIAPRHDRWIGSAGKRNMQSRTWESAASVGGTKNWVCHSRCKEIEVVCTVPIAHRVHAGTDGWAEGRGVRIQCAIDRTLNFVFTCLRLRRKRRVIWGNVQPETSYAYSLLPILPRNTRRITGNIADRDVDACKLDSLKRDGLAASFVRQFKMSRS